MRSCKILFDFYLFVHLSSAANYGIIYKSVTCLSEMSETFSVKTATLSECAILADIDHKKAFSFDKQTGECKGFIEDPSIGTCPSSSPGGAKFYKIPSDCSSLPVPPGYNLEYPYNGNTDLARYRCQELTDQPPVDHCPIAKCGSKPDISTPLASCSVKDRFNSSLGEYEGGVTCTVKGVTCQRWDTNFPHTAYYYKNRSDLRNKCQKQYELRPWCYTMDPNLRWDYCPFADWNCGHPTTDALLPPTMTGASIEVEWPYQQYYELAWYRCASSVKADPVPSCPVSRCNRDLTWTQAAVSCSEKDCYNATSLTYSGRVSCTMNGITCQRWDQTEPHWPTILSGRSDLENWCQIADEDKPWCYTTNPQIRWQFCPVDKCPLGL